MCCFELSRPVFKFPRRPRVTLRARIGKQVGSALPLSIFHLNSFTFMFMGKALHLKAFQKPLIWITVPFFFSSLLYY